MEDSIRDYTEAPSASVARSGAGIIRRIRLENFMCHSNLQIELGDWVNFITGQNGSGKSAILTALCVAFGCRARGTQRASTIKDFIKTGCSNASVLVEIKNQGDDAFKREKYGDIIIIERRITESSSSIVLKDYQGKKIAQRREELNELVEHFNIDIENPCVIMSQDKSREFLHSGTAKDKFKFFYRATLLQQVSELLQSISGQLESANAIVDELESSIRPIVKELDELQEKIKNMEHIEEISQEVQNLKKKLAWSWVYDVDRQIEEQRVKLEKLKERISTCQERIDRYSEKAEKLNESLIAKKARITFLMEKTSEVRKMKEELQQKHRLATTDRLELKEEYDRGSNIIKRMSTRLRSLEQQVHDIQEQYMKNSQAAEFEIMEEIQRIEDGIHVSQMNISRLQEEENAIRENITTGQNSMKEVVKEIEEYERKYRELSSQIRDLRQQQANKVTAFGGEKVLKLLEAIERHHRKFKNPPIGPIGAHVTLIHSDKWALAVDCAIGKLLDAFIVTDHRDSLLLRGCAREAQYHKLQIIISDFSRPRLNIPSHMVPATDHPTTLSVLHSDNHVVMNVLVDMGHAERQVLVPHYEAGKSVAFDQNIRHLKEVYTSDGFKMFSRGSVQTTLPPNRRARGRLCRSVDDQISALESETTKIKDVIGEGKGKKRMFDGRLQSFEQEAQNVKRRRTDEERSLVSKQIILRDKRNMHASELNSDPAQNVEELNEEILNIREKIQEKEVMLKELEGRIHVAEEKANGLLLSFENICDSAKGEMDSIEEAEKELMLIEEEIRDAESEKTHYEGVMQKKVLHDIKEAEALLNELTVNRQENFRKASIICSESEMEAVGGCSGSNPERLSSQLTRLKQKLQRECQRFPESIDDLRMLYDKKERKILKKRHTYEAFRDKLNACQKALDLRWTKFHRNATLLKRQMTWQFNGHLRKKGISGHIKINYEERTLNIEVIMPQDASGNTVRDTKGLSGGERSFSTLCFTLALHEMTEAPFRSIDEFDVFMDAVSRKISLDTLVEFAVAHGSQWIFITPHDICMVKAGERIKKQQMSAPRS